MGIIVQKFGGTSVGSTDRMKRVAGQIVKEKEKGNDVVVVVSAMANTTDTLVKLAGELSDYPGKREMDMLLSTGEQVTISLLTMALQHRGMKAVSLTGRQAGIRTDDVFGNAKITSIDTGRIKEELSAGRIVVVAGFQGVTEEGELTTLGRGGSDTSAAALASALKADRCDIYTDVDGVYTSDPRVVPRAAKIDGLSYTDMLRFAMMGANVLHPRAIKHAKEHGVPMIVRSSLKEGRGTVISGKVQRNDSIVGVALQEEVSVLTIHGCDGGESLILYDLDSHHIETERIRHRQGLVLIIKDQDIHLVKKIVRKYNQAYSHFDMREDVSKVCVIGSIQSSGEVKEKVTNVFHDYHIGKVSVWESSVGLSAIVDRTDVEKAARILHMHFGLDYIESKRAIL
ncbi:aspartate kinase [Rossellomorea vietnamensis]|uniref:Aspartate kinase n=1 Tax=Rossellomorea vietnamensis TaxID=218284 RepID=A0ACD4C4J8_9BACI|nr:aspartate kinase [Rossellomorea vietnamensis]UXH43566.1 aspartate kinase [Rossellomorea vietnamensis]WQI94917.1 aspartate kinase [Rossellomorea vietnamensis]